MQFSAYHKNVIPSKVYWLLWAVRKVLSRDPLYVPRRVSYSLRKVWVKRTFSMGIDKRKNPFQDHIPKKSIEFLEFFRKRRNPRFHFGLDQIEEIIARIPHEEKNETIREAENYLKNLFTFRGIGPVLWNGDDWSFSPASAKGWTDANGWNWDLNRHFFFANLGFAYWYTKDVRFAEKLSELSSSWINGNLRNIGKNVWDHPFEVAARINAWIWGYFLLLPYQGWDPENHKRFLYALGHLGEYLYQRIEYHNPGNHILLEAKALALCAGLFPEFKRAKKWHKKAWSILGRELKKQICIDGVHAERSAMYHRIVSGELGELLLFCRENNYRDNELKGTVCRMAEFLSWITGGLREMPVFGDAYREDSYYRFWAPAITKAICPGEQEVFPERAHRVEQTIWAMGGKFDLNCLEGKKERKSLELGKAFLEGGYLVSRWGWGPQASAVVWDCGPVGYKANPYHGHLDALSFVLTCRGVQFLIDPGTDELELERNRRLRSTKSHNTIVIDGENQSILAPLGGRNEVWSLAKARVHLWATCPECDVMIGAHDGYSRLKDPVVHRRAIISMRGKYWLLLDRLEGKCWHTAEQRFHLAPEIEIDKDFLNEKLILKKRGAVLFIYPIKIGGLDSVKYNNEITFEDGIAELFALQIQKIQAINIKREGPFPLEMAVVLAPDESKIKSVVGQPVKGEENQFATIEVHGQGFKDQILFGRRAIEGQRFGNELKADAEVVILREVNQESFELWAAGVNKLRWKEKILLEGNKIIPIYHIALDQN